MDVILEEIEEIYDRTDGNFVMVDLGCGNGQLRDEVEDFCEKLGERELEFVGLDEYPTGKFEGHEIKSDLRLPHIPVKDNTADLVFSNNVHYLIESTWMENYQGEMKSGEEYWTNVEEEGERILKLGGTQIHTSHFFM